MDKFKSIISNQEGQNLFPGLPTLIKGDNQGTQITMKNTSPQVALTPYGASYMMPNQDYNFAGNSVLELSMNKAQAGGPQGGGQEQLQQILMAYAQMKGMKPEELMKKLQALPKEQQQQAIQAIAQEVQQAMAQQQQGQEGQQQGVEQQEAMMGQQDQEDAADQQQDMGMAMHGGEHCTDCEEQFPQAQNLEWYYKKAMGGEAFPQAQTYFPYDRGSKPAPNFMFQSGGASDQYGGSADIDQVYQIMKAGGFDMDPKKKKGGKFDATSFEDYVMKNGGLQKAYVGVNMPKTNTTIPQFRKEPGPWNNYNTSTTNMTNDINEVISKPMTLKTNQSYMQDTSKIPNTGITGSTPKTPTKGQYNPYVGNGMTPYDTVQYMGTQGKPGGFLHGIAAVAGLGNALATSASGYKEASKKQTWKDTFPFLNRDDSNDSNDSNESDDYEYLKAAYGGMLPKAQFGPPQEIKTGQNLSQPQGSFNTWGATTAPAAVQNNSGFQQVQQTNQALPQVASWNQQTQGTDTQGGKPSSTPGTIRTSGIPQATSAIAGLSTAANFMEAVQQNKADKDLRSKMNTSEFMGMAQMGGPLDYGDYLMNATQGPSFRPNSYVYAQKESEPYMDQQAYYDYAEGGSILDNYEDDQEYDLTQEEIDAIMAAGGSIDYI